jgi:hypothetical protein
VKYKRAANYVPPDFVRTFAQRFLEAALSFCRVVSEIILIGLTFTTVLASSKGICFTEFWLRL